MANAKIALQLSSREGFEVRVSEALHAVRPVVTTCSGGIPLQVSRYYFQSHLHLLIPIEVQHGKNGYPTEYGDTTTVAWYLFNLWTDQMLYARFSEYAKESVSDEVGTVGNALCWLYLSATFARGEKVKPKGVWINDMARDAAGEPYTAEDARLPRPDLHVQA